jgi:hypothetical protein
MCDCDNKKATGSVNQPDTPNIDRFVLYAERSIKIGEHSHVHEGDIGVRTPVAPQPGAYQLLVARHAECRNLFAPSVSLEMYSESRDVWTNSLNRVQDIGIGAENPFPTSMPPLPLALASGKGRDILVPRKKRASLGPGTYGALTLLYDSELWLAAGQYVFSNVMMDEKSSLLGDPGAVDVRIVGGLWTDREAKIGPHLQEFGAKDFMIAVAGVDSQAKRDTDQSQGSEPTPTAVVYLAEDVHLHALLPAPHGTVLMGERCHLRGAIAAFDIQARANVRAEFQDGFSASLAGQQGSQQLSGYYGPHPNPAVAALLGPVPADTKIWLNVNLPVRDSAGLKTFVQQVSDPKSPTFRKYITQAQFTSIYGATAADYQALQDWATASGFTIDFTYANNLLLSVTGTAAQIEQALYVNLVYRTASDGSPFVAVDREPSLGLAVTILEINGLANFTVPRRAGGSGGGGLYQAADLRQAYLGSDPVLHALTGAGQVVGLFELATWVQTDIQGYAAAQKPPLNANNATLAAIAAPPWFTSYQNNEEVTSDIELVLAMAPGAQVLVFQGALGITSHGDAIFHTMANWTPQLTCASCSWTFGRSKGSQQALDQMASQGVSFFTASGDYGDIGDPQSNVDMDSQTLVGGTILNTNAPAIPYPANYYIGEGTWNQATAPHQQAVTSGGIMDGNNKAGSSFPTISSPGCYCWPYPLCCGSGVPIPSYQLGIMQQTATANQGSTQWRNYPDVAMVAQNLDIFFNGSFGGWFGTSAAAPLWAGFVALVNQRISIVNPSAGFVGFANPTLYEIGVTRGLALDLYQACFNDIFDGQTNNDGFGPGFTSVAGYDLCTGLGSPKPNFIYQVSSPTPTVGPFDDIGFVIGTGDDDLRGHGGIGSNINGTGCTADILLQGYDLTTGVGVKTVTLKPAGANIDWAKNTTTSLMFFGLDKDNAGNPIPPVNSVSQIAGIRINIQQDYGFPAKADKWDIASIRVWLFNPPFHANTATCVLNLAGTATLGDGSVGLIRLGDNNNDSTPIYNSGSGC